MKLLKSENGQSTVFMAAFAGLLMAGFLGLALDVGYLFREQRMAQAAADSAAMAAAEEDGYGNSGNVQTAANSAAQTNGFDTTLATNPATVTLTKLNSGSYSNAGSAPSPTTWVQATVSRPVPTFFLGAFNSARNTMTVSATATVGEGQTSPTCICMVGSTGQNLNMSNGSKLSAVSCGIVADSNASNALAIYGGSTLSALTLGTVSSDWDNASNVSGGGTISASTKVIHGITNTCGPTMPTAPVDTSCSVDPVSLIGGGGVSYTVGPNSSYGTTKNGDTVCYNGLTVGSNGNTVTMNPGTYVINGGSLHFENGTQKGGAGVFFYLTNGASLTIDNGANVNLVAPTSGTYNGILFYQDANDTNAVSVAGGSGAVINGAIYAPGANINLSNGSGTSVTADIVAQTLNMSGGGTLTSKPASNMGTLNVSGAKLTQ